MSLLVLLVVSSFQFSNSAPSRRQRLEVNLLDFNPSMVRQDGPLGMDELNMLHADAVKFGADNLWFTAVDAKTLDSLITEMNEMNRWFAKVVKYWDDFTSGGDGSTVLKQNGKGIKKLQDKGGNASGDDAAGADEDPEGTGARDDDAAAAAEDVDAADVKDGIGADGEDAMDEYPAATDGEDVDGAGGDREDPGIDNASADGMDAGTDGEEAGAVDDDYAPGADGKDTDVAAADGEDDYAPAADGVDADTEAADREDADGAFNGEEVEGDGIEGADAEEASEGGDAGGDEAAVEDAGAKKKPATGRGRFPGRRRDADARRRRRF